MEIKKTTYRFFNTLWKALRGLGILVVFLLVISFSFVVTDNWFYRIIIIVVGIGVLSGINLLFGDKEEERYFLIVPLKLQETIRLLQDWLSKEGFVVSRDFSVKNLKWLKTKARSRYRVYNFYAVSETCSVVSENILQDELISKIDVFFDEEIKSISTSFKVPVYYIAEEHSIDLYASYYDGQEDKKLSFYTHGPGMDEFKEQGKPVEKEEIKRRDYFSNEDYVKGLNFPLEIHRKSIRKIIKSCPKERMVFSKRT